MIPQYRRFSVRTSQPWVRALSVIILVVIFIRFLTDINPVNPIPEYEFSSPQSFSSRFSRIKPLKYSTYRYEAPQDLVLPQWQGRGIETESLIGKVTILFHGKDPTYIRAIQTHQAHNRRHGYPLLALRHAILDGIWSKPAYILAVLLEELRKPDRHRLRWLFWVDADTVVTNPKIPLEIFLPPEEFPDLHLLVTADPHGINNGIFFLKVHPWTVELLSAIIAYPTFRPDENLEYRDQSALEQVLKEKLFKNNFAILPQRWINAYQAERDGSRTLPFQITAGDLLVHFPGVPERDERMRYYLDIAERHWPKWEKSLDNTTYPEEIRTYWIEQQGIQAKQRKEAQRVAKTAREYLGKAQEEVKKHQGVIDSGQLEVIDHSMTGMKDALEDDRDNLDIVKEVLDRLKKSMNPVRSSIEKQKNELHAKAKGLILQSDQILSAGGEDPNIISQKEGLQRLLAEAPDDQDAIRGLAKELEESNGRGPRPD